MCQLYFSKAWKYKDLKKKKMYIIKLLKVIFIWYFLISTLSFKQKLNYTFNFQTLSLFFFFNFKFVWNFFSFLIKLTTRCKSWKHLWLFPQVMTQRSISWSKGILILKPFDMWWVFVYLFIYWQQPFPLEYILVKTLVKVSCSGLEK